MEKFIIEGGRRLCGEIDVQSAKNSVLPLMAASVLTDETTTLLKIPLISDVMRMADILKELGCSVKINGDSMVIDGNCAVSHEIPSSLTKELRSSVFVLGSVLTRFKRARIAYPGGCDIGLRPIDLHLNGLKRLGVKIREEEGYVSCEAEKMTGAEIVLDFPSVGATENIMLAAVKAEGTTVIRNAAREPEIKDLQNFLNAMGARIRGGGESTVVINGVNRLHGVTYEPIKDRIEAGTYLIAAAICGGEVAINGCDAENIASLLHKLRENGCKIRVKNDKIILKGSRFIKSNKKVETSPFPGFPTDLQSQILTLNAVASSTAVIVENLFETRFRLVPELIKMGADITVKDRTAIVRGVKRLTAASVYAEDLRGGAALALAALNAEGISEVNGVGFIDRGYGDFEGKLKKLGAKIKRVRV